MTSILGKNFEGCTYPKPQTYSKDRFIYGLYNVPHSMVPEAVTMAHDLGINKFDTAQLYGNETICYESVKNFDDVQITTKIYHANTTQQLSHRLLQTEKRIPIPNKTILLHRWMDPCMWSQLAGCINRRTRIGVSNYTVETLQELLQYCVENKLRKPDVVQIEVHPFVDCVELIKYCQWNGIDVEAHTVLARGKYFDHPTLVQMATQHHCTVPQLMISWALSKGVNVCVKSLQKDRLQELLDSPVISSSELRSLDTLYQQTYMRFYKTGSSVPVITDIVKQLKEDMSVELPSRLCEKLPIAGYEYVNAGGLIAAELFPEDKKEAQLNKYRKMIKNLRSKRLTGIQTEKQRKKGLSCPMRHPSGYMDHILNPRPMPVDETDPVEFEPFYQYLTGSEYVEDEATFVRGTVFSDGRMDLCKQVVGPSSIVALCENTMKSKLVKHFLLGNNIAFRKPEKTVEDVVEGKYGGRDAAIAMCNLMKSSDIETYYLAGNEIDGQDSGFISIGLLNNTSCKALWLKRNPINPLGCGYLNTTLRFNQTLVLLDLHNCAVQDAGLEVLLYQPSEIKTLRHLYLDANAIEELDPLVKWCQSPDCRITSLYLSINRLGDDEVIKLCDSLVNNKTLKRLCLASALVGNRAVPHIVDMALSCPNLICLNLGCYKSSKDMGERPGNLFDDEVLPEFQRLLGEHGGLLYFNVIGCQMSFECLEQLKDCNSHTSVETGSGAPKFIHDKDALQIIKHPKRVRHIASVYRGKM